MQQRSEPHDSLDDFPTPPWATRALCYHVIGSLIGRQQHAWDPACNRGYMVRPLTEYFARVYSSDIFDYSNEWPDQGRVVDFLWPNAMSLVMEKMGVDWIITNPPFRLAEQFIQHGLEIATHGVAMLVRTSFVEGVGRYERLFKVRPPSVVAQFVERVPMVKGRLDKSASTATSYCWLVWDKFKPLAGLTELVWIPPCRKGLERPGDYDA